MTVASSSTPSTPASKMERLTPATTPGGTSKGSKEEKIVVTVRLRPLSKREQLAKDHVAWECIDEHTIVYKPQLHDRSTQQASFTFGNFVAFHSILNPCEVKLIGKRIVCRSSVWSFIND